MRQAEPIYLPGFPEVTGNYEILQQCLTEEKTLVLLLDKRINKIKSLSNHQWKIACHFNSTLRHEARASWSFHVSCNAIIPALNRDGCCSARLLSHCAAWQTPACRHFPLCAPTWVSSPKLPASACQKKSGTYFSPFIWITAKGIKSILGAEDHSEGSSVDRIRRAQYMHLCRGKQDRKELCINCSHHKRIFANCML